MRLALEPDDAEAPEVPSSEEELPEKPETDISAEAAPEVVDPLEEPPEEAAPSKSLARIMEREEKLLQREQKLESAQPELENLRTRVEAFESAQGQFTRDPIEFIRSKSPDTDFKRLAETLWYESQGGQAPQKYLQQKEATHQNKEVMERIAKIEQGAQEREQRAQQASANQAFEQYQGSLNSFASTADAAEYPLLSAMQAKNPEWVAGTMIGIARQKAQATQGQVVLSPEQVAKSLETQIAQFQIGSKPAPAQQVETPVTPQGTSLRNNSNQTQPDLEAVDELSDEFLRNKAFEAMGATHLIT